MPVAQEPLPPGPFGLSASRGDAAVDTFEARVAAILADRILIRSVDAPAFAAPGDVVRITVTVEGEAPIGTDAEGVVTFTRPDTGETIRQPETGIRNVSPGQRVTFTHSFVMPDRAVVWEITALEKDVGTLRVTDTATARISASAGAAALNPLITFGPWVAVGAGVGAGAARVTDNRLPVGAGVGAGVGLGAGWIANSIEGPVLPEFPTTAVFATAALLGTTALVLGRVPGLGLLRRGGRALTA